MRPVARALLLLAVLSATTEFVGLGRPNQTVFDEVYFASFAASYCCTGERFFDIHPPHGKLLVAGVAKLLGFRGQADYFALDGPFPPGEALELRVLPALAGMLLPLVVFGLLRHFGASLGGATFGGAVVVFDNALTVQSRLVALDGLLLLFTFAAVLFYYESRARAGAARFALLLLCGICAGLAPGVKYTGLVAPGLVGLLMLVDLKRPAASESHPVRSRLLQGGLVLSCAVLVFCAGWWLHFRLLTEPGPGDGWGGWTGRFWADMLSVQGTMLRANDGLAAVHQDASAWWQWPAMLTPIYYWSDGPRKIYFVGNPAVWWGSSLVMVAMTGAVLLRRLGLASVAIARRPQVRMGVPVLGFLASYLPLLFVHRALFMYHYLTPLVFASMASVLWLDRAGWFSDHSMWPQRFRADVLTGLLLCGFVLMAPFTYATSWGAGWRDWLLSSLPLWP